MSREAREAVARAIAQHVRFNSTDEIDAAADAAIAAYEAAQWRPIEEAPKDGTFVLLWANGLVELGIWNSEDLMWPWSIDGGADALDSDTPTHFRPLPPAPEDKG